MSGRRRGATQAHWHNLLSESQPQADVTHSTLLIDVIPTPSEAVTCFRFGRQVASPARCCDSDAKLGPAAHAFTAPNSSYVLQTTEVLQDLRTAFLTSLVAIRTCE